MLFVDGITLTPVAGVLWTSNCSGTSRLTRSPTWFSELVYLLSAMRMVVTLNSFILES